MGFFFSFSFFLIFLFNMLKLPRLVQYDILNLTGTHSMKTPPGAGLWGLFPAGSQSCGKRRRDTRAGAARDADGQLRGTRRRRCNVGMAQRKRDPRCVGGFTEEDGFSCGCVAACARPPAGPHPCRRRGGSSTGRNAAALPKATTRLDQQLHEATINTLHPCNRSSCLWCPAEGELPAEPCCPPACKGWGA